ncbi:MAG: flagellin lysine-N-methylase [Ruminococcus sp.]|nr:flagellin lysine-N-methylase [Ruminococcus sp.]
MLLRYPDIFFDFKCLCGGCEDNCCQMGWDIEIDEDTYTYYKGLGTELGRRLCENIYEEDGALYMGQPEGCPFMDGEGLCSVQLECGAEHISEICREHPRFYEWFGDVKEAGLGLCCEEVCRLVMEHEKPILFTEREIDEAADELEFDRELFREVRKLRDRLIDIAQDRGMSISQRMMILAYSTEDIADAVFDRDVKRLAQLSGMLAIDGFRMEIVIHSQHERHSAPERAMRMLCSIFERMEYMGNLGEIFTKCKGMTDKLEQCRDSFEKAYASYEHELENILVYFIWRYFIKCTRDLSAAEHIFSALICTAAVRVMFMTEFCERGELPDGKRRQWLVKEFSKEIEYDSDNMDIIYEEIQEGRADLMMLGGLFG